MLTVDYLAILQVLLKKFDTSIDAVLDLVIGADLNGYFVPERSQLHEQSPQVT